MKTELSRNLTTIRGLNQEPTIPYIDRGRITEKEMMPEPPVLEIKISHAWTSREGRTVFEATLKDWDLGVPFGRGLTIQDAIENFLEAIWMKWYEDFELEEIKYKWS